MPGMDAQKILDKAADIEAAKRAARSLAISSLATILAERKRLEAALADTEAPYRKAYAKAGAAGWSDAELSQLGADKPEPPRRGGRGARSTSTARSNQAATGAPAESPVNV